MNEKLALTDVSAQARTIAKQVKRTPVITEVLPDPLVFVPLLSSWPVQTRHFVNYVM